MTKSLAESTVDRQNILNNKYAISEIQESLGYRGNLFEGEYWYTRKQILDFFEISDSTLRRYLDKYSSELRVNGYEIIKGKRLKEAIKAFGSVIDDGTKTTVLGLFKFRAFLNLAMLIVESEKARSLRSVILDIVIDEISKRAGGATKYINQRDENFIINLLTAEGYRKEFTAALHKYVDLGPAKYTIYTNKIYVTIFKEKAHEYRKVLKLSKKENVRSTMYSEVLDLISGFETGLADEIEKAYSNKGGKLNSLNKNF